MDYKYIEQLLERYWNCETTVEEESILKAFFSQSQVPEHLMRYRDLFAQEAQMKASRLNDDFDARILAMVEETPVKARRITFAKRLMPIYKAAAAIALIITVGTAYQHSMWKGNDSASNDYNYDSYQDTYTDPAVAYGDMSDALNTVSETLQTESVRDSLKSTAVMVKTKDK